MATRKKRAASSAGILVAPDIEAGETDLPGTKLTSGMAVLSHAPVEVGDDVTTFIAAQVPPGGSTAFRVSGQPGAQVTITLARVAGSGGHSHGGAATDPAAVGQASPTSFTLPQGYPQNVRVVYRASDVCGTNVLTARFNPGNPPTIQASVEVLVAGLQPIPSSAALKLKAPLAEHPSPYWATPGFIGKLVQLANKYFQERSKPITVTDASLQWGGRFDLRQNWAPPHAEHRDGNQADLRSHDMNPADKQAFLRIAAEVGIGVLEEGDHWHVRG